IRPHSSPLYGGASFHDGISFNAETQRVVLKAVGSAPTITNLTSAFTFTCGNQSMYRGANGLLVQAVTNTPRIEYDAGGSCLGLLMEASRTNLALQSQDLSTSHSLAALLAFGSGSTVNAIAAPDGTTTADKIVEDTSTTLHRIRQTTDVTIASGNTVAFSYFVKAAERTRCRLRITENTFASAYEVSFNLATATVGTAITTGVAVGVPGSSFITAYANGWYRIGIAAAINGGFLTCRTNLELEDASGNNAYTGDGASGLYAWGEQIEVGNFASSYIPTTTIAVARTADSCIRTLGSEFSATAGTVVIQGRASRGRDGSGAQTSFDLNDASALNSISLNRPAAGDVARFSVITATVEQGPVDATFVNSSNYKAAMAFALNDLAFSFNGAAVSTDTVATLPTATRLELGCGVVGTLQANGHIRTFDYYPMRQSDAFLQLASA
ncbi:MAG: hypothetical protein EBR82_66795, partial [Caulobacteraceae bacterium]|nr:hypothetical protein [Caulobacteraceae bacterium]